MIWFLFKLWITIDLALLLADFYREAGEHNEMADFLEEYYRR